MTAAVSRSKRTKRQKMWAVLNYDRVMCVGFRRRDVQDEIAHSREDWKKSRRAGWLKCVPVVVTWTSPVKRKAKVKK